MRSYFFSTWYPCQRFIEAHQADDTFVRWSVDMRPNVNPYMVTVREEESQQENSE